MVQLWLFPAIGMYFINFHTVQSYNGPKMGKLNDCDDGKSNLTVDWDEDFVDFTCTEAQWKSRPTVPSKHYSIPNFDPENDQVTHYCMNSTISYNDSIPLRGPHRPNWPVFGEYLYVPPQRWLHNLEHGTIVMLYHPCADLTEVAKLRLLLASCLKRHIITPYREVSSTRPLVLVSWGSKLEMNAVDPEDVVSFILNHARKAPEDVSRIGKFDEWLINPAHVVSDEDDTQLCPNFPISDATFKKFRWNRNLRKRSTGGRTYYDKVYLKQLQQHNGPKFANDVLPPSAMNKQFEQPSYVMAGTYLGQDPYNPDTGHKTVTKQPTLSSASGRDNSEGSLIHSVAKILRLQKNRKPIETGNFKNQFNDSTRAQLIKILLIRLICRNQPELLPACG